MVPAILTLTDDELSSNKGEDDELSSNRGEDDEGGNEFRSGAMLSVSDIYYNIAQYVAKVPYPAIRSNTSLLSYTVTP